VRRLKVAESRSSVALDSGTAGFTSTRQCGSYETSGGSRAFSADRKWIGVPIGACRFESGRGNEVSWLIVAVSALPVTAILVLSLVGLLNHDSLRRGFRQIDTSSSWPGGHLKRGAVVTSTRTTKDEVIGEFEDGPSLD